MKRTLVIAAAVLGAAILIQAQDAETPTPDKPAPRTLDREKGKRLYDLRFADRRKAVEATAGKDDDVVLAEEHLQGVTKFAEYPSLAMVLAEQAYELGMRHRNGYATASRAAEMLLSDFPELKDDHLPKVFRAYEAQYRSDVDRGTAGERLIELYIDSATASAAKDDYNAAFQMLVKAYPIATALRSPRKDEAFRWRRYYQARRDLQKKPSDLNLRKEVILITLRERDLPAEAVKLLTGDLDETLRTCIPLAAKPKEEVDEAACLELGGWYLELSEGASSQGERICLKRAKAYLDRFLVTHEAKDEPRLQAELLRDKVDTKLLASRPTPPPPAVKPKPVVTTKSGTLSVKKPWPFSMKITKGQTIQIVASGKWRIRPGGQNHGPNAPVFFFRGRIGNGAPFKVGAKYTLKVKEDNVLHLGIKEGGTYSNNTGQVKVTIKTTDPAGTAVAKPTPPKAEHDKYYLAVSNAYLNSNWPVLHEKLKLYAQYASRLSQDQRADMTYVRKEAMAHPPSWWKSTSSSKNITFTAKIWGRSFKANYIPSEMLGAQGVAEIRDGRLMIVVTWQPQLIDNPDPVAGKRAKVHKLTKGDFAESIVWHELGHNYVTEFLPASQVIDLYTNYRMMFGQLQEFFADMTSLYHARPKARKCILFIRLPSLVMYYENDPHTRAAYGIGSIFLNEWLKDPENIDKAWPHIHLPATMPAKDIERNVLAYIYYHWDPKFSVSEDIRFRELIKSSLTTKKSGQRYTEGERILRSKGTIELSDGLQFKFMPGEDRLWKTKRDAWVKQQLLKAIKAGKTDTKAQAKKIDPWELISSPEIRSLIGGGM